MSNKQAESMTEEELLAKIKALGLPEGDARIPSIVCSLIGHSHIVEHCFGYVHCARCSDLLGDRLAGSFTLRDYVIVGHDCDKCQANYAKMGWVDKILCSDPFTKKEDS